MRQSARSCLCCASYNGSSWYISGVPDERWDNDELAELHSVTGAEFEAVEVSSLMVDPDSSQIGIPCQAEDHLTISDLAITDRQLHRACEEILVGANVSIFGPDGHAIFSAGQRVAFANGLAVFRDGRLEVAT